jgi:hypothetical protein
MLRINDKIIFRDIDGQIVLVNLQSGFYYSLNETGTVVFRLIKERRGVSDIVRSLADMYELPQEAVRLDLDGYLDALFEEKILVESE